MRLVESIVYPIAKHWIAGASMVDAIERAKKSNSQGSGAIINLLGEHTEDRIEISHASEEYGRLLRQIKEDKIRGSISVKPSQLGLGVDREFCKQNLNGIIHEAKALGIFVWLDMEGSKYTEQTIDLYLGAHRAYEETGLAVQANLRRTWNDVDRLLSNGGRLRLCKGAYNEPSEIAFKSKKEVDNNFSKLMVRMFEKGRNFAIATHDDKLIDEAVELSQRSHRDFEFQMLIGIREDLKPKLIADGYVLNEYIPYGKSWLPYSIRRIRERKRNILLLLRSLF